MNFISCSQAGQDKFAYERIGNSGTFLDIGCGDQNGSNTLGREKRVIAPKVWFTGLDYRDCVPERWERL